MYKKMLIPLDRSELAEAVIPYATEIAARLDIELILLHVVYEWDNYRASNYKPYLDRVAERLLNQSHYARRHAGVKAVNVAAPVQRILIVGNPAEEILHYTEQNDIDLLLMATHGRSGISRWALGSVADKVLRRSNVPVWLVRTGTSERSVHDTWPKMKMLVPLDGSKSSELVLPHVEALAKQRGVEAEVVLIRVLEPVSIDISYPEATNSMVWEPHIKQVTSQLRSEYKQYLTGIEQRLSSSALNVRSEILTGEPAMEIIEFVNKNPINLVVMATHGRSGISRWAYGSVADKVLRRASCPLLLVRVGQAFWWTISS